MDNQPVKELVRKWLRQRQAHPAPLPDIEQIQRQLGWTPAQTKALSRLQCNMELSFA